MTNAGYKEDTANGNDRSIEEGTEKIRRKV